MTEQSATLAPSQWIAQDDDRDGLAIRVDALTLPVGWTVTVVQYEDGSAGVALSCGTQEPTSDDAALSVALYRDKAQGVQVLEVIADGGYADERHYSASGSRFDPQSRGYGRFTA